MCALRGGGGRGSLGLSHPSIWKRSATVMCEAPRHPLSPPFISTHPPTTKPFCGSDGAAKHQHHQPQQQQDIVYICEYEDGVLLHQEALKAEDLELIFGPVAQTVARRRALRGGRRR